MPEPLAVVARPWARLVYAWRERTVGGIPRPQDEPRALVPGSCPDRVLVFGNGYAVGWGVRIHDLAVTGHLTRALDSRTHRGAEVETRAHPLWAVADSDRRLREAPLDEVDAVVLVLGASDAFRLLDEAAWVRHLTTLIGVIRARTSAPIALVGITQPSSVRFYATRGGGLRDRWTARLNARSREVCAAHDGVVFVEPAVQSVESRDDLRDERYRGPIEYRCLAERAAGALAPLLDAAAETAPGCREAPVA